MQKKYPKSAKTLFGAYIRACRLQKGWNQRQLGDKASIDYSYLYKLERGDMPPPSDAIMQNLAQALEVPVEELYRRSNKVPSGLKGLVKDQPILAELVYTLSLHVFPEEGYQHLLTLAKSYA